MELSIIDIGILLIIFLGGIIGFREGAIKKGTSIIGLILVVTLSFMFKNKVSMFFYENLPFIRLWGVFKGIDVLNVLFYELVAFLSIFFVLSVVYRVLLMVTGLIEKILKATIILSIPSKIIGFFIGMVEYYVIVYIFLFIFTLPIIGINDVYKSSVATSILRNTPILSKYSKESLNIYYDIMDIVNERDKYSNEELNVEAMRIMIKYDILTVESAQKLIDKNKVIIYDSSFLNKYK